MRWLTLYARSRQVPASLATVLLGTVTVWMLAGDGGGAPADPKFSVFLLVAGVTAASVGLGGQDPALDRTAAVDWRPRRAAHVLFVAAVVCAVFLAARTAGAHLAATAFVVRDSAGLTGLAALGAVLCGAQYAWTLPIGWLSFSVLVPAPTGAVTEAATWLLMPPGTTAATWTAGLLAVAGTAAYALAGPRR